MYEKSDEIIENMFTSDRDYTKASDKDGFLHVLERLYQLPKNYYDPELIRKKLSTSIFFSWEHAAKETASQYETIIKYHSLSNTNM